MPRIAFLPWAVLDQPVVAGEFTIAPFRKAAKLMSPDHATASRTVIAAYDMATSHQIARVPVLYRTGVSPTEDVSEAEVGALFQISEMVAFAALASRQFFMDAYWNRESFYLVVQGFLPEHPGGAAITSRRRDGFTETYASAARHRVQRPAHVAHGPVDRLDRPLLEALIASSDHARFDQLMDAIRGFNMANTDSPTVSQETELITLIGAYSRLFDVWDEKATVNALLNTLAVAPAWRGERVGPKPALPPLRDKLAKSRSMKREWMTDAYVLRGQFAHGHSVSPYRSIWGLRDHLLLGSYLFPLTVKAWLAKAGLYRLTPMDLMQIAAFDALATFDHFEVAGEGDGDHRRPSDYPWVQVTRSIPLQLFLADLDRQGGNQAEGPATASPEQ